VLLVHRFFEPDATTYSRMLAMIGRELAASGYDVTVFSTQPSYNDSYDGPPLAPLSMESGVTVRRTNIPGGGSSTGRLAGGVVFCALLLLHVLRNRKCYDLIMVSTVPPVLMGATGRLAAKLAKARFVYHCMDIYPEIALYSGLINDGMAARLARWLDGWSMRGASEVIVLSEDMEALVKDRAKNASITVLNNFSIGSPITGPAPATENDRFELIFAGNLGRFQGLETLLEGFADFMRDGRSARLTFLGNGVLRDRLSDLACELGVGDSVAFPGHVPYATASEKIASSDLAIVTLAPRLIRAAYPSKTITYLEQGARVLAIVESPSSLADLINENNLGSVAEPGHRAAIAEAIAREYERTWDHEDRHRAHATAESSFSAARVLPEWPRLLTAGGDQ